MKVLVVHSHYQQPGGEDSVFKNEADLLSSDTIVRKLEFRNKQGVLGLFQYFFSIWNLSASTKLRKVILSFQPQIIHIHNWHFSSGPVIIRTAKGMGIPVVVTCHNYRLICPSATLLYKGQLFTSSLDEKFPWRAIFNRVYRNSYLLTFWLAFINWFHKKIGTWQIVDRYIALTEFSRQILLQSHLKLTKEQISVKSNFTTESPIKSLSRKDGFLFVGRLSEEKGINTLLEAFVHSSLKIRIAGDGPMKEMVKQMAKNRNNIHLLGKLNIEEVKAEMLQCTALIFPSICYETFGLTIIEAFANSTPVIASNISSASIIVKNEYNGLHFESGNPSDLRKKLELWQSLSENEKSIYRSNAQKTYEEYYTPEKNLEQLLAIYQSVINENINEKALT